MTEYEFDVKLFAKVTINAASQARAVETLDIVLGLLLTVDEPSVAWLNGVLPPSWKGELVSISVGEDGEAANREPV